MLQSLQGKRKRGGTIGTDMISTNGDTKKIKIEAVQPKVEQRDEPTAVQVVQPKAEQAPDEGGHGGTLHATMAVHPPTNSSNKNPGHKQEHRQNLLGQASAIVHPDSKFLTDRNAAAQAAGSLYERNTFLRGIYTYRGWSVIDEISQKVADKLRELSNAEKLIWFNVYDQRQRQVGGLYYKLLFRRWDIAPLIANTAKTTKAAKITNVQHRSLSLEERCTKEEQIEHKNFGLRALNRQARAEGSAYERNTFQRWLLGYTFLPRGNAYLTRRSRELSNATSKIWFNVHSSDMWYNVRCPNNGIKPRLGLLVQDSILVTAKRCEEETREYRESLRAKRNAANLLVQKTGSEGKASQTKATRVVKKLPTEIPKKDRSVNNNPVAKTKAKKAVSNPKKVPIGAEIRKKDRPVKDSSVVKTKSKKVPTEIPKKDRPVKESPTTKEIIDLVSDDGDALPLPDLEPTAHGNESSDEESSIDSDSDWDPEKDDVEGVLVGETYKNENGPRRTRGSSQRLGCVWGDEEEGEEEEEWEEEEEEDKEDVEDKELRRLEERVKHELGSDGGETTVMQEPGIREGSTALVPAAQEVHARIKTEMNAEMDGGAGWQDDFEWEMA